MQHSAEMRRCLEQVDVAGVRALWKHVSPNMPQPTTDAEALVALHHARTQSEFLQLKMRAYSHRWLQDRGYPSGLPDHMKAPAERIYPTVALSVGISVNAKSELFKPVTSLVREAMEHAVLETYADGHQNEPAIVSARMQEAREKTTRQLIGRMARG